mgnify:CR=1 FL=1
MRGLYLVTDRGLSLGRALDEVVLQAVRGGVSMVQLREKEAPSLWRKPNGSSGCWRPTASR